MNNQFDYTQPIAYNPDGFGTPTEKKKNGYATAALILGIISMVIGCCCICCFLIIPVLAVIAIVLAVLSKSRNDGVMPGKAKAGMILAIIALVLVVVYIVIYGMFLNDPAMFSEYLDPVFQEEYGMTFEEYVEYVENMGEYDTLPLPKSEIPME